MRVRAGRQGMRVVTAGSEGAGYKLTTDCPYHTVLYYNGFVLSCANNQPVMPEDALCVRANPGANPPKRTCIVKKPRELEKQKERSVCKGSFAQTDKGVCVSVRVVIPFILDVRLVDAPAGVTEDFSTFLLRCLP